MESTKAALLQRIGILIARSTAKAVQRRDAHHTASRTTASAAAQIISERADEEDAE